jgi:hypothetical protein
MTTSTGRLVSLLVLALVVVALGCSAGGEGPEPRPVTAARGPALETDLRTVKAAVDAYITSCACMPTQTGVLPRAGEYAAIDFYASCGLCPQNETFYPHFLLELPKHWDEGVWLIDSTALVSVAMSPGDY